MSENIKTWPEKVKLFNCGHGFLEQYQNGDDETNVELYIRSDIVADREEKLIAAAYDCGRVDGENDCDRGVRSRDAYVYGVTGLEKLK